MSLTATEGWFENGNSSDPGEAKIYYFNREEVLITYRGSTFQGAYEGKGIVEFNDGSYFEGAFKSGLATGLGAQYSENETTNANYFNGKKVGMAWRRIYS